MTYCKCEHEISAEVAREKNRIIRQFLRNNHPDIYKQLLKLIEAQPLDVLKETLKK